MSKMDFRQDKSQEQSRPERNNFEKVNSMAGNQFKDCTVNCNDNRKLEVKVSIFPEGSIKPILKWADKWVLILLGIALLNSKFHFFHVPLGWLSKVFNHFL